MSDSYYIRSGSFLGVWGIGILLLLINNAAEEQFSFTVAFLLPVALIALITTVFSRNIKKLRDGSQVLFLCLCISVSILSTENFFLAGTLISLFLILRGFFTPAILAPVGASSLFIAYLSPAGQSIDDIFMFSAALVLAAAVSARKDNGGMALYAFPMFASLYLLHLNFDAPSVWILVASIGHAALIFFLQLIGIKTGTNRKLALDDIVLISSFLLMLKAITTLDQFLYFLIIAGFFLCMFVTLWAVESLSKSERETRSAWMSSDFIETINFRSKKNAAIASCGLAMALSVNVLQLSTHPTLLSSVQSVLFLIIGGLLHYLGKVRDSTIQRDFAKLILVYSVVSSQSVNLGTLPYSLVLLVALIQFASIGVLILIATNDLKYRVYGAWQGIFSGRSLVALRQAQGNIFAIVSQAPLIGWIFGLMSRFASNLKSTFKQGKPWTISNYAICVSVISGAIFAINLSSDLFTNRLPLSIADLGVFPEIQQNLSFEKSISQLFAILIYSTVLFLVGAWTNLAHVKYLSTLVAGALISILAFIALASKTNPISVLFFPLTFFALMFVTRLFAQDRVRKR